MCGFAQGNSTLKGDVNGDNKVDVADIITIVEIIKNGEGTESDGKLYYYVGPEQPSKENYKTIGTEVTEYPNQFEYTSEDRQYLYGLVASDKALQFIDPSFNASIDIVELTDITIPGYKVIKSATKIMGKIYVKISDCDYYLGVATEEQVQDQSYINSLTYNQSGVKPTQLEFKYQYNVLIVPSDWGTPTIKDGAGFTYSSYEPEELGITYPPGKSVFVYESGPMTVSVTWDVTD